MKTIIYNATKLVGWLLLVLTVVSLVAIFFKGVYMLFASGIFFLFSQVMLQFANEIAEEFKL